MLIDTSAVSCPLLHNSARRLMTCPGEGRNKGRTRPAAVDAYQRAASTANTSAATPRNWAAAMRPPSMKSRRRATGLLRCRIHETAVDSRRQIDVLLQDAGCACRGMHFGYDLAREIAAKLGLVLRQRIVDDAFEGRCQFFRLGSH